MICESCVKLFCRCPTEAHKRQPKGVQYEPLKDKLVATPLTIEERRDYARAEYKRKKDARKNG